MDSVTVKTGKREGEKISGKRKRAGESHQDKQLKYGGTEPLLYKDTRLNGPVGCKIQGTFCWPCSVPQEKRGPLSNSQTPSDSGVFPLAQAPFPHLPNGVLSLSISYLISSFANHNQHCILLIWVCVPVQPLSRKT